MFYDKTKGYFQIILTTPIKLHFPLLYRCTHPCIDIVPNISIVYLYGLSLLPPPESSFCGERETSCKLDTAKPSMSIPVGSDPAKPLLYQHLVIFLWPVCTGSPTPPRQSVRESNPFQTQLCIHANPGFSLSYKCFHFY